MFFCEKWLLGCRDSHPQFRGSSLGTPGTFGAKTIHLATKYDEERLAFLNSSFPTGARVKSLDCALICFKARKIRLEHEGSVGRSTRRSRLVATEHRYIYIYFILSRLHALCHVILRDLVVTKSNRWLSCEIQYLSLWWKHFTRQFFLVLRAG